MFGVGVPGLGDHGVAALHADRVGTLRSQEPNQSPGAATNINNSLAVELHNPSKPIIVRRQIPQLHVGHPPTHASNSKRRATQSSTVMA